MVVASAVPVLGSEGRRVCYMENVRTAYATWVEHGAVV